MFAKLAQVMQPNAIEGRASLNSQNLRKSYINKSNDNAGFFSRDLIENLPLTYSSILRKSKMNTNGNLKRKSNFKVSRGNSDRCLQDQIFDAIDYHEKSQSLVFCHYERVIFYRWKIILYYFFCKILTSIVYAANVYLCPDSDTFNKWNLYTMICVFFFLLILKTVLMRFVDTRILLLHKVFSFLSIANQVAYDYLIGYLKSKPIRIQSSHFYHVGSPLYSTIY
jgi:hypothetical protein